MAAAYQVSNMPLPRARFFDELVGRMHRLDPQLAGPDAELYDGDDLVAIKGSRYQAPLSRLIARTLLPPYHYIMDRWLNKYKNDADDWVKYAFRAVERTASVIDVFLASLMLILVIVVLYSLRSMTARLVSITLFTMMYGLYLALLTDAPSLDTASATSTLV